MWPGLGADILGDFARITIDRSVYTDAAIFKSAYWMTNRYHIYLASHPDNHLVVEIRAKTSSPNDSLQDAAGEFCNALIDYRVRAIVLSETAHIRDALVTKAFMEGLPKLGFVTEHRDS